MPVGVKRVHHAGGESESNTYLINLYLPNMICVVGVAVTEYGDTADHFGAIVGMDVISQGDLATSNLHGRTWMSFRMPSIATVDYVVESHKTMFAGTRRNDTCPCGSGGQY